MRILIVGTAGREFHLFATVYRDDPAALVIAFTSADLPPGGAGSYPSCLTGPRYPEGLPILPEAALERLIAEHDIDQVVFAYAELGCSAVAGLAARVLAAGADFQLVSPRRSMLASRLPVIAVTSAWSGAGESPTLRHLAGLLASWDLRVAVVRHPLPGRDFTVDRPHALTVSAPVARDPCAAPEREPYAGLPGATVFSGLDVAAVLQAAESEADVVLWDGAGSDVPFIAPSLHLVLTDPLRGAAAELFPGEVGLRTADAVIVSKCDSASAEQVAIAEAAIRRLNPGAVVITADSPVIIEDAANVAGRTVVVLEDELALNLGTLRPGAGLEAACQAGAAGIISPRPQAVGALAELYARHPEAQSVLPVTGYGATELAELKATLEATPSEAVVDASAAGLAALLGVTRPVARAGYAIRPHHPEHLAGLVRAAVGL